MLRVRLPREILSNRLALKVVVEKYAEKINEGIRESNFELKKWVYWAKPIPSIEETINFCRLSYAKFELNLELSMIIELKEGSHFVGCVRLRNSEVKGEDSYEVGYWGNLKYSRNGYISEAVTCLKNHAFEQLDARLLYLTTDDKNERSWKLAERCGFKLEKIVKNERLNPSGFSRDTRFYSICPENTIRN